MKHVFLLAVIISLSSLPAFTQQRWERTYGGARNDEGYSVQQTNDGGYIVVGSAKSFGDSAQVYLIKTNASGDTVWTRTYGGTGNDEGLCIQQTKEGGYIITGYSNIVGNYNEVYLIKTNATGDTLWTRTYGGTGNDHGNSVQQTSDRGYIITGGTTSFGNSYQVYLIKTNASGDTLWTRAYGGWAGDLGESVQQTMEGGFIIAGQTYSFGDGWQVYLIKTNSSGDTLWTRTYGGASYDLGYSVCQTQDTGYIVAGVSSSFGNGEQVYLVKTDTTGDTLWTRTYGGTGSEEGYSVRQTSDGGYIIAGKTYSAEDSWQVYLIKTNAFGDTLWTRTYGGTNWDEANSVQQTQDGGYIVAGYTHSFGDSGQVYLIKTDENGNVGVEGNKRFERPRVQGVKITPNPFISFATVPGHEAERFSLYDVSGRKVGTYPGSRIGEGLAPGVYFVKGLAPSTRPLRVVKVR